MVTHVAVPVRDQWPLTRDFCACLAEAPGWDCCWIFDNGSTDDTHDQLTRLAGSDHRFKIVHAAGLGIYEMWRQAFKVASSCDAATLIVANNDITFGPELPAALVAALEERAHWLAYPDYDALEAHDGGLRVTTGTYRHGGMSGFCFAAKVARIDWAPLIDPALVWWGGDDDLAFEVERRGGLQVRCVGLPVVHVHEGTARHHDLGAAKDADLAYIIEKWGR